MECFFLLEPSLLTLSISSLSLSLLNNELKLYNSNWHLCFLCNSNWYLCFIPIERCDWSIIYRWSNELNYHNHWQRYNLINTMDLRIYTCNVSWCKGYIHICTLSRWIYISQYESMNINYDGIILTRRIAAGIDVEPPSLDRHTVVFITVIVIVRSLECSRNKQLLNYLYCMIYVCLSYLNNT